MSTRSTTRNLFLPLYNHELTIRRRSRTDTTLLNNSEIAAEGPDDLPVAELQTMEELCQPSLNGRGGPIAPIAIQATNFGLKNDMIQQVQNSCQFHGLPGDDANKHLDKFLHVTQSIKVNGVTDDALCLYLFPHSLTHHSIAWFDRLPRNSIHTFEQMAKMFLEKYFPSSMVTKLRNEITNFHQRTFMKRRLEECYDLIENMTAHHNDWDTSTKRSESSNSVISSSDTEITTLKAEMAKINKNLMRVLQVNQQVKAVTPNCETCGGPHSFFDCPATVGNTQNVYAVGAYQAYQAPVHQPHIPQPQVVTTNEFTNFIKANDAILKNMQTNMTSLTNSNLELKNMFGQFMKMNTASSLGSRTLPGNTITNPKEDLKGITTRRGTEYPGPTIPATSSSPVVERETEATKDMMHPTNNGSTEEVQPPVVPTESPILTSAPVTSPIIEPFASPVSTPRPNQRPSIPYPSRLQDQKLQLADCSISRPVGVAEDVFVKVGTFHFSADFVVVDFNVDPRVPLILGRSFLKTGRALIDVFEGELTFRVGKEAITFNLDQTSRYSANYNDMTAKRIDVIDMDCEEYSQEVLGFSNMIASGNPTPYYDPIVSTTSSTLTPSGNCDFLLEEVDAFLAIEDDPTSPKVDQSYVDTEGDILLLEAFLNDDPSLPPPNQGNYLPEVCNELKICEAKSDKSSIDEPPEVDKAKVDVITKLPHPTTVKGIRSFLGHAGFYRHFIKDFSKIALPMAHLLEKDTPFILSKECVESFKTFKRKLTEAPILIAPDWDIPFELICDARTFPLFAKVMKRFGLTHHLATSYHLQTSGQVKVSNRGLKCILERTVGENHASWSDKLDDAFWAFRTAYKTPIGCTPYKLVYGKACHLPIELEHKAYWALKHGNFDLQTAGDHRKV
nr:reverse transcriptase domain-containing protein [Tanacetum cinerariifolium]